MTDATKRSFTGSAQRLWLLERDPAASGESDARPFLSAISVLTHTHVCVCFVRSVNAERVDGTCLHSPYVRSRIARDARTFDSLDEALVWAEHAKSEWLRRGWSETLADLNDR